MNEIERIIDKKEERLRIKKGRDVKNILMKLRTSERRI